MDGVDAVLARFTPGESKLEVDILGSTYRAFADELRAQLFALQAPGENELHREAIAANALATLYAEAVADLLQKTGFAKQEVRAIGAHGQTVRHRPECGYTRQIGNAALLAELTGIDVVADFRSRDVSAGGQGAPLVPAFHQAIFGDTQDTRVVANIGGIANISVLHADSRVTGFDTGPGNVLLDLWCMRHRGLPYDANGAWAESGHIAADFLRALLAEPYLQAPPPKSTGRDLFHAAWLDKIIAAFAALPAADVQATLTAFTAITLADAVRQYAPDAGSLLVCGGGAFNAHLMRMLAHELQRRVADISVQTTAALGVPPDQVEALAFAWLAQRHIAREPGNLPSVTGAAGPRILGALSPG